MTILYTMGVLGGLGLVFGILLGLFGKVFHVPADPRVAEIREALPGANCGACGRPGCDGYAEAVAAGAAPAHLCTVGGAPVAERIAAIMGVQAGEVARDIASVRCQGSLDHSVEKFEYQGIPDCLAASLVSGGGKACPYACIGLGTCEKVCPFEAIRVDDRMKIAVVEQEKCRGCGLCVSACPRQVLALRPADTPVELLCRAALQGKLVKDNCKAGCIGCGLCEKACEAGAISMAKHLPVFDLEKCTGCMLCAKSCPTKAIRAREGQGA